MILTAGTGLAGCSSADDPEGETGGTSGTSTGGTSTGGTATGGTSSGGTSSGGTSTGGTATGGTATGGTGGNNPMCTGISRDQPCPMDGLMCPDLVCGLADQGSRECNCATTWSCTSCSFAGTWVETMPADVQPCPSGVADEVACTTDMTICGPQPNGEYCACWQSPTDGLSWDCDDPPSSWGI